MLVTSTYAKRNKLKTICKLKINGLNKSIAIVDKNDIGSDLPSSDISLSSSKYTFSFSFPKIHSDAQKRFVFYIAGPSGAGKTTIAADLAFSYHKANLKNKIVFISTVNDNPLLKRLKPIMINVIDEKMVDYNLFNPETRLTVKDDGVNPPLFKDSLVIFDDLEGITDKNVLSAIQQNLINPMLNTGRHQCLNVIFCRHILLDYEKTRNILVEMDFLVVYPSSTRRQIRNCLKRYLGLEKDQMDKIMNCGERYVFIHCKFPMFAFTKSSAWII